MTSYNSLFDSKYFNKYQTSGRGCCCEYLDLTTSYKFKWDEYVCGDNNGFATYTTLIKYTKEENKEFTIPLVITPQDLVNLVGDLSLELAIELLNTRTVYDVALCPITYTGNYEGEVCRECPINFSPQCLIYSVTATSTFSQEDANNQAYILWLSTSQQYANNNDICVEDPKFCNTAQSASAFKVCPDGFTSNLVTYTVPAGTFCFYNVDQSTVDALALQQAVSNAQAYANEVGVCTQQVTYCNTELTETVLSQCPPNYTPSVGNVTVTIPACSIQSTISIADANAQAQSLLDTILTPDYIIANSGCVLNATPCGNLNQISCNGNCNDPYVLTNGYCCRTNQIFTNGRCTDVSGNPFCGFYLDNTDGDIGSINRSWQATSNVNISIFFNPLLHADRLVVKINSTTVLDTGCTIFSSTNNFSLLAGDVLETIVTANCNNDDNTTTQVTCDGANLRSIYKVKYDRTGITIPGEFRLILTGASDDWRLYGYTASSGTGCRKQVKIKFCVNNYLNRPGNIGFVNVNTNCYVDLSYDSSGKTLFCSGSTSLASIYFTSDMLYPIVVESASTVCTFKDQFSLSDCCSFSSNEPLNDYIINITCL